jgi:hypothetical protein
MARWTLLGLSACTFDPSGVPPRGGTDGGEPAPPADAAPVADGSGTAARFCDPTDPSLVACWTFEPVADATRLEDGSQYGNHGLISGAAVVDGIDGRALAIDAESIVAVADSGPLDATDALTIEGWVRVTALPPVFRSWMLDQQGQYGLAITESGRVNCAGAGRSFFSEKTVAVGEWTHVACVVDGAARLRRAYVAGAVDAEVAGDATLRTGATEGMLLGADSPCAAAPCPGQLDAELDQIRIWRAVRTPEQLCQAAGACP